MGFSPQFAGERNDVAKRFMESRSGRRMNIWIEPTLPATRAKCGVVNLRTGADA